MCCNCSSVGCLKCTKLKKNIAYDKFYLSGWTSALWVSFIRGQNLLVSDKRISQSFVALHEQALHLRFCGTLIFPPCYSFCMFSCSFCPSPIEMEGLLAGLSPCNFQRIHSGVGGGELPTISDVMPRSHTALNMYTVNE